jgi:ABC-type glutathione transport system ATPase component
MEGHPDFEYQLKAPFTSAISGSSGCGKSTLIKKLLKRRPSASYYYILLYATSSRTF